MTEEEETKVCCTCGRELPVSAFSRNRWRKYNSVCKRCVKQIREMNRTRSVSLQKNTLYSDPEFDSKTPREVQDILARAAKWLNNYGGFTCEVNLRYEKSIHLDIK